MSIRSDDREVCFAALRRTYPKVGRKIPNNPSVSGYLLLLQNPITPIISALFCPAIVAVELGLSTIPRPPVYRIVLLQLLLALVVAALAGVAGSLAAKSALFGGLICAVPNAYFVWRTFRYQGARQAHNIVNGLYKGAAWKFFLTALSFAVLFRLGLELNYFALFAGFVMVQLGHVFSSKMINL